MTTCKFTNKLIYLYILTIRLPETFDKNNFQELFFSSQNNFQFRQPTIILTY